MAYTVTFTKGARKDLLKISEPYYSSIKTAIAHLVEDPRPPGCKKIERPRWLSHPGAAVPRYL